jgi:hypothetical protein
MAVSAAQENNMRYFKELAKVGREYLERLENERQAFIRANNKEQIELYDKISAESSPKKENDGTPE